MTTLPLGDQLVQVQVSLGVTTSPFSNWFSVQSFHDAEAAEADPTNLGWDGQGGLRVVTLLLVR